MTPDWKPFLGSLLLVVSGLILLIGLGVKLWPIVRRKLSGLRSPAEPREILGSAVFAGRVSEIVALCGGLQEAHNAALEEIAAQKAKESELQRVMKGGAV